MNMDPQNTNVAVIGLGVIGLPVAIYARDRGFSVSGYDVSDKAVERAKERDIRAYSNFEHLPLCSIYVVCVNTRWSDGIDLSAVERVLAQVSRATNHALICVESTMPVGSTRALAKANGLKYLVHAPHRLWPENMEKHGVNQLRVIGALNQKALTLGLRFFRQLGIPLHVCPSLEVAEMTKVAENAHRYLEIAWAQELARMTESVGLRFEDVRDSISTHFNYSFPLQILEPRDGIGGTCLPKDIQFLRSMAQTTTPLLDGAIQSNAVYLGHVSEEKHNEVEDYPAKRPIDTGLVDMEVEA
jgi:nucleotide sugar dehydrogenase